MQRKTSQRDTGSRALFPAEDMLGRLLCGMRRDDSCQRKKGE